MAHQRGWIWIWEENICICSDRFLVVLEAINPFYHFVAYSRPQSHISSNIG